MNFLKNWKTCLRFLQNPKFIFFIFLFFGIGILFQMALSYQFGKGGWFSGFFLASLLRVDQSGLGSLYPTATSESIPGTLPYNPLVVFIGQILLQLSVEIFYIPFLVGLIGLICFMFGFRKFIQELRLTQSWVVIAALVAFYFIFVAQMALSYGMQAKPDFFLLGIGYLSIATIFQNKTRTLFLVLWGILGFLSKQQFIGFFAGAILLIAYDRSLIRKIKFFLLGGVIGFGFSLMIPHWFEFAILGMKDHPIRSTEFFMMDLWGNKIDFIFNLGGMFLLVFFIIVGWKKKSIFTKFALFILPTVILGGLSFMKLGGNQANLQFNGLLLFPFYLGLFDTLFQGRMMDGVKSVAALLILFLGFYQIPKIKRLYIDHQKFTLLYEMAIIYIQKNFPKSKVDYLAPHYPLVLDSGLNPGIEFGTYWHYRIGGEGMRAVLESLLKAQNELVFFFPIHEGPYLEVQNALLQNYHLIRDKNAPLAIRGFLWERNGPIHRYITVDEYVAHKLRWPYGN